jgi:hypothetical protein
LIRQLFTSIAGDLITSLDLIASRLSTLDGSLEPTSLALKLFGDLLSLAFGPILIVVDELEILDFSGDAILEGNLERIFEILRNEKGSAITKSLFTNLENSVLMDVVGWERTVDASLGSGSDGFMTLDDFASLRM